MKYIIVMLPTEDEGDSAMLSTRKQFNSFQEALEHTKSYAECHQERVLIVECPKGLTYPKPASYYLELEDRFNMMKEPWLTDEEVQDMADFHNLVADYSRGAGDRSTMMWHLSHANTYERVIAARKHV